MSEYIACEWESLAYITQATAGDPIILCVMDNKNQKYHQFTITLLNAARLAAECAGVVNSGMGGFARPPTPC